MDKETAIENVQYNIDRHGFDYAIDQAEDFIKNDPLISNVMTQRQIGEAAVKQRLKELKEQIS